MTGEEAIRILEEERDVYIPKWIKYIKLDFLERQWVNALELAIKALEQESILDKIKAEILEEKECAYADFEQYKVEYLGVDAEYAEDELPQDDYRYGMERAIELIDKYREGSEGE